MPTPRRHDLDALRVGAFLLLILYHIGMFYVPWDWHVKSDHILPQLQLPMGLVNPWRLTLLFVISGAATRFMADKFSPGTLARQRSVRLLVPLLFGMIVVVPPQSWIEVIEKTGYTGGYLEFWSRYLSFDQSFGMFLPTYNHLWFVAYLWIYTILALAIWPAIMAWERRFPLTGIALFFLPVAMFGLYRAFLFPHWPETHILWHDVYAHMHYGTAFLVGILLAKQANAWGEIASPPISCNYMRHRRRACAFRPVGATS